MGCQAEKDQNTPQHKDFTVNKRRKRAKQKKWAGFETFCVVIRDQTGDLSCLDSRIWIWPFPVFYSFILANFLFRELTLASFVKIAERCLFITIKYGWTLFLVSRWSSFITSETSESGWIYFYKPSFIESSTTSRLCWASHWRFNRSVHLETTVSCVLGSSRGFHLQRLLRVEGHIIMKLRSVFELQIIAHCLCVVCFCAARPSCVLAGFVVCKQHTSLNTPSSRPPPHRLPPSLPASLCGTTFPRVHL